MSSSALTAETAPRLDPASGRWIQGRAFDLGLFVLGPIVTLPIVVTSLWEVPYFPFLGFLMGFAHYLSTVPFLLWDENRPYHRARWTAFYGGPALMTALYAALVLRGVPYVIQFVLFFWNVFHVARQSSGIVSLYRHRNGVTSPEQRKVATAAILSMNFWFSLWNIETHRSTMAILEPFGPAFPTLLWIFAGAVALYSMARLLVALWRRAAEGAPASGPELAILATSFLLFHPFLWYPESGGATFAMLLPHYLQYLALVWLLHRRKFPRVEGSRLQRALLAATRNTPRLLVTLGSLTLGVAAVKVFASRVGHAESFEHFYLLVGLLHFYTDGLVWAFRDPHVRRSIGPHLSGGPVTARAA